jgi:hypothetical protein
MKQRHNQLAATCCAAGDGIFIPVEVLGVKHSFKVEES